MLIPLPSRASEQLASALTAVCTPYVASRFTGVGTAKNVNVSINGPGGFNWSATVESAVFAGLKGTVLGLMPGVSSASVKGIGTGESFSFDENGLAKISGSVLLDASKCEEVSRWAEAKWPWADLFIDLPKDSGLDNPTTAQSVLLGASDRIKVRRLYGSVCGVPLEKVNGESELIGNFPVSSYKVVLKGDPAFWRGKAVVEFIPATSGIEKYFVRPNKMKYDVDFGSTGKVTLTFFFKTSTCDRVGLPLLKVTSKTEPQIFALVRDGGSVTLGTSCPTPAT